VGVTGRRARRQAALTAGRDVEVRVDEVVLIGFDRGVGREVGEQLVEELARLVAAPQPPMHEGQPAVAGAKAPLNTSPRSPAFGRDLGRQAFHQLPPTHR
jgi:hypothetical protein